MIFLRDIGRLNKLQIDWRTQLIAHGLKSFYDNGTCASGHLIYDWIEEVKKIELPMEVKKKCWRMANKNHNQYKKHLVNAFLSDLLKEEIMVSINVSPIKFKV